MTQAIIIPFRIQRRNGGALFDHTFGNSLDLPPNDAPLNIDVVDASDSILIKADVPGASEEDISLRIVDDSILIQCEKKDATEEKGTNYYVLERGRGIFTRSISFPFQLDPHSIEAVLDNGLLTVRVPKPGDPEDIY